jgi:hypothetical protein
MATVIAALLIVFCSIAGFVIRLGLEQRRLNARLAEIERFPSAPNLPQSHTKAA